MLPASLERFADQAWIRNKSETRRPLTLQERSLRPASVVLSKSLKETLSKHGSRLQTQPLKLAYHAVPVPLDPSEILSDSPRKPFSSTKTTGFVTAVKNLDSEPLPPPPAAAHFYQPQPDKTMSSKLGVGTMVNTIARPLQDSDLAGLPASAIAALNAASLTASIGNHNDGGRRYSGASTTASGAFRTTGLLSTTGSTRAIPTSDQFGNAPGARTAWVATMGRAEEKAQAIAMLKEATRAVPRQVTLTAGETVPLPHADHIEALSLSAVNRSGSRGPDGRVHPNDFTPASPAANAINRAILELDSREQPLNALQRRVLHEAEVHAEKLAREAKAARLATLRAERARMAKNGLGALGFDGVHNSSSYHGDYVETALKREAVLERMQKHDEARRIHLMAAEDSGMRRGYNLLNGQAISQDDIHQRLLASGDRFAQTIAALTGNKQSGSPSSAADSLSRHIQQQQQRASSAMTMPSSPAAALAGAAVHTSSEAFMTRGRQSLLFPQQEQPPQQHEQDHDHYQQQPPRASTAPSGMMGSRRRSFTPNTTRVLHDQVPSSPLVVAGSEAELLPSSSAVLRDTVQRSYQLDGTSQVDGMYRRKIVTEPGKHPLWDGTREAAAKKGE